MSQYYASKFPKTFEFKNAFTPYNQKEANREKHAKRQEMRLSLKKEESKASVNLNNLTDFSSDNPELQKILLEAGQILKNTTKASGDSVFVVDSGLRELHLLTGKEYTMIPNEYRFPIEEYSMVAAQVAINKEYIMLQGLQNDPRFPRGVGIENEEIDKVLCVPVVTPDGNCFAVIELYRTEEGEPFTKDDLKITIVVTGWMGAAVHQNIQRVSIKKQEVLHDHLLSITKRFFDQSITVTDMVSELMNMAKRSLGATKGTFFLLDKESDELIADVFEESIDRNTNRFVKKNLKIKLLDRDRGMVTLVARSGNSVNVKDPSRDRRISNEPELRGGKALKSLLCIPVMGTGGLLGIYRLVNKKHGFFTRNDEKTMKIFVKYTSCCLQFNALNNRLKHSVTLGKVYRHILDKQLRPCPHEEEYFYRAANRKLPNHFLDFKWYIPESMLNDMPQLAVRMVKDLNGEHEVLNENLMKFMLTVRRLYRNNPYHNFEHAFTFLHCMYAILKRNSAMFTHLEMKALLVASICHDIDHGGMTNNFLMITNDVIYQLYPESPWENYHYLVTSQLLERISFYKSLSRLDYKLFLKEIKDAILATDLQMYFRNRLKLLSLINDDVFEIQNSNHKALLKTIMMTVCDLSGQCMPYSIARRITENVYREFYDQGDKEKKLGVPPLSMMDRDKQYQIPEDQIQFLSVIVLPATEILKNVLSNTSDLYHECLNLQRTWQEILEARERKEMMKKRELEEKK